MIVWNIKSKRLRTHPIRERTIKYGDLMHLISLSTVMQKRRAQRPPDHLSVVNNRRIRIIWRKKICRTRRMSRKERWAVGSDRTLTDISIPLSTSRLRFPFLDSARTGKASLDSAFHFSTPLELGKRPSTPLGIGSKYLDPARYSLGCLSTPRPTDVVRAGARDYWGPRSRRDWRDLRMWNSSHNCFPGEADFRSICIST